MFDLRMSGKSCIIELLVRGTYQEGIKMSELEMVECPEHGGGFDCTPFCKTCEGEQGYYPTNEGETK